MTAGTDSQLVEHVNLQDQATVAPSPYHNCGNYV